MSKPTNAVAKLHKAQNRAVVEATNQTWDPRQAMLICERIADGMTLVDIAKMDDVPSRPTIYRWLTLFPEFYDAYERAKELSAQSFEDEALGLARVLAGKHEFTGTRIKAYEVAMAQLRWSAARRDKVRYGSQTQINTTVPIQINTTLDLGQGGVITSTVENVYNIEALVPPAAEAADEDTPEEREPLAIDFPNTVDDNARAFGIMDKQAASITRKRGRPSREETLIRKGKHKSPRATALTAARYAARKLKHDRDTSKTDAGSDAEPVRPSDDDGGQA